MPALLEGPAASPNVWTKMPLEPVMSPSFVYGDADIAVLAAGDVRWFRRECRNSGIEVALIVDGDAGIAGGRPAEPKVRA